MARVAFLLPDLRAGGAELLILALAEDLSRAGHSVELVVMRKGGELMEAVPADVVVVDLGVERIRSTILPFARYLRTSHPDAVHARMWPMTIAAVLARRLSGHPHRLTLGDDAMLSKQYGWGGWARNRFFRWSMRACYPLADARVVVSSGVAGDLAELASMNCNAFEVIANPVLGHSAKTASIDPVQYWPSPGPRILAVGSLKNVKNFSLLLDAFAILRKSIGNAQLSIVGEGQDRTALENKVAQLELADAVTLPGFVSGIGGVFSNADLFVLSSNHEGFGNVIVEAMSHGVPVVSTNCPGGPSEILGGGKFGKLVPCGDAAALAHAMQAALSETSDPDKLRQRADEIGGAGQFLAYRRLIVGAVDAHP